MDQQSQSTPGSTWKCLKCREEIQTNAVICKHCGTDQRAWPLKHPVLMVILGIILLPIVVSSFSSARESAKNEVKQAPIIENTTASSTKTVEDGKTALSFSLKEELKKIESFDGLSLRKQQEAGEQSSELSIFDRWGSLVSDGKRSTNKDDVELAKTLEKKASAIQIKEFPLMRKISGERFKRLLWEKDIDVKISGRRNEALEFIGAAFASHQNISDFYGPLDTPLEKLRFTKISFRWYAGSSGSVINNSEVVGFPKDGDVVPSKP